MMVMLFVLLCVLLYLFLIMPNPNRRKHEDLDGYLYAHRGLWNDERPENSLSAYQAAVSHGYGIELDVRMTKDQALVILHDADALRMCGTHARICDSFLSELMELKLKGTGQGIPRLEDALSLIAGKVPLIVEIKTCRDIHTLCRLTADMLETYDGPYCIESFDPRAVRWFRIHRPNVLRGQLVFGRRGQEASHSASALYALALESMVENCLGRPDFIAMDWRCTDALPFRIVRKLFHPWLVAWTVSDQRTLQKYQDIYDLIIFEGFEP